MADIVRLKQYREEKTPHIEGPAICLACRHEWHAIAPSGTVWLECPECHVERGLYRFHCERDGAHWACGCGNTLFRITPEGIYCPNCGAWQKFPLSSG